MPVTVAGPRRIRTGFQKNLRSRASMNDERIIEGGHGSRKSFISAQWRAGKGWVIFFVAMRPLAVLLLCCLVPVTLAAQRPARARDLGIVPGTLVPVR